MKWLAFLVILAATPVHATDWTLTVNDQELALVGKALGQQPYNDVNLLIAKLNQQINEQRTKQAQPLPEAKPGDTK